MIRGALLGAGKIALTAHLPAFLDPRLRDRAEIVAVADPSAESRALARNLLPNAAVYESAVECLQYECVDFADVCAPPHLHRGLIETAAGMGAHILCEKPLAITEPDAAAAAALLRRSPDLVLLPCHQYRHSPLWKQFHAFRAAGADDARWFLQFDIFRTEADPGLRGGTAAWRTDPAVSGGGILADTGVHYLYLAVWMMGMPLRCTVRTQRLLYTQADVEDTAVVLLEYPNGIVQLNLTWGADRRANSARCVTRAGSLVYDGTSLMKYAGVDVQSLPVPDASDKSTYTGMYVSLFGEFLDQIARGGQRSEWVDEAYGSVRLLNLCYRSAREGRTIDVE